MTTIVEVPHKITEQWLFSEEDIKNSPSALHGLDPAEERSRRAKGVNFIVQAGILLKIPQLTLGTASVFFHRFFMRASMIQEKGGVHHYNIAATALFLATKAEENMRKTKEIVIAVAKVAQKNPNLVIDEQSKEFWRWKDNILLYEELMLEFLTFDVVVESPYSHFYAIARMLEVDSNSTLRNTAWGFLNDSYMTTLCLLQTPKDIAIAALYFSAKFTGETIQDTQWNRPWWEAAGGEPRKIFKAIEVMTSFWRENPLNRTGNPSPGGNSPSFADLESTRKGSQRTPGHESNGRARADSQDTMQHPPSIDDGRGVSREVSTQPSERIRREEAEYGTPAQGDERAGDNDEELKRAANDPATHQDTARDTGATLGNGEKSGSTEAHNGLKRKETGEVADTEEGEAETETEFKRLRTDETVREQSEEGEVGE